LFFWVQLHPADNLQCAMQTHCCIVGPSLNQVAPIGCLWYRLAGWLGTLIKQMRQIHLLQELPSSSSLNFLQLGSMGCLFHTSPLIDLSGALLMVTWSGTPSLVSIEDEQQSRVERSRASLRKLSCHPKPNQRTGRKHRTLLYLGFSLYGDGHPTLSVHFILIG
jgi:hypothetical protein